MSPRGGNACTASVEATSTTGRTASLADSTAVDGSLDLELTGLADDGAHFDPGPVQIVATVTCEDGAQASVSELAWIARLGITQLHFGSTAEDEAAGLGKVPLAYHKTDLWTHAVTVLDPGLADYAAGSLEGDTSELDDADGARRSAPAPHSDPDVPPWGAGQPGDVRYNLPLAYVVGSTLQVDATLGSTGVSAHTGAVVHALGPELSDVTPPDLRLVLDGASADADATIEPGGSMSLSGITVGDSLGVETLTLSWSFEARADEGAPWLPVPGTVETSHTLFRTAGQASLRDGESEGAAPAVAWVGVLDDLLPELDGAAPEAAEVLDALRDYLHFNQYLLYNPGDSAYTDYVGSYTSWQYITADLSGWLDRSDGLDLYCHSVSCLLSTLAGHVGIDARQQVLGTSFQTNLTRAAGDDDWQRWSFTLHSVVSPDDGQSIWDASVALDGDDDPHNEPVDEVHPMGMPLDEYLWRLSPDDHVQIISADQCYFE